MSFIKENRSHNFLTNIAIPGVFILCISLLGLLDGWSFLVYIGIFILILNVLSNIYVKFVDQHIEIENESKKIRCYLGEEGEITFTIVQKGILPILGVTLIINYDRNIAINENGHTDHIGTEKVEIPFRLLSFEKKQVIF